MRRGEPLTDADRWPWLDSIAAIIAETHRTGGRAVVACSALKRTYVATVAHLLASSTDGEVVVVRGFVRSAQKLVKWSSARTRADRSFLCSSP